MAHPEESADSYGGGAAHPPGKANVTPASAVTLAPLFVPKTAAALACSTLCVPLMSMTAEAPAGRVLEPMSSH